ncbi:MAG: S41 family peptidase [Prevotellaceae bacterium]|nr:S41 family peptidase [Prevotellaceae bacterium]
MKNNRFTPLILAGCIVFGIFIGTFYANHFGGNRLNIISSGSNKISSLLHIIKDQYVDDVNLDSIVEEAIPGLLAELDPHSAYISANDAEFVADELKGSFSGIGVEFTIRQDTIHVQNVISNGPAERAGLIAGDKIVKIDGKPFTAKGKAPEEANREAMKRLKGEKDTKVKVGVVRYGEKKIKEFVITRGEIPQRSITATHLIDENTGYIRIKNFGDTTYAELLIALANLAQEGVKNLVIDLRDNGGGYLQAAVMIANEFLPKNKLIVYQEGRKLPRQDFRSDGHGSYQKIPLVVLINEGSASASEILAGALQDNDRATIIGRRSFGKGLVQKEVGFSDKSVIRLTIARYYTPSGRCIQKPYVSGNSDEYAQDIVNRYNNGEFFSQDSIKHSGKEYHTNNGRVVYGGGGITPDIFVPEDTLNVTSYYKQAAVSGLILQYAFTYTDDNRQTLNEYKTLEDLKAYLKKQNLVEKFASYADNHGLKRRNLMIQKSYKLLERYITSRIIYNMLNDNAWSQYLNEDDEVIREAQGVFERGEAFPKKPAKK